MWMLDADIQGILDLAQGSHTKQEGLFMLEAMLEYTATGEAQAHRKAVRDLLRGQW